MSDDLVERVARVLVSPKADPSDWRFWTDEARAAIAVALEEAAKLCDERIALLHGQFDVLDVTRECDAYRIAAAAIRAMIPKEPT